jgi:hypothetical protein
MRRSESTSQRFAAEKAAYWAMREDLMRQYHGQWVAVVNGQVVAVGNKAGKVLEEAYRKTGSEIGFVAHVGYEQVVRKIRQATTGRHDGHYDPPMPMVTATVTNLSGDAQTETDFIVDTGSDGTTLQ